MLVACQGLSETFSFSSKSIEFLGGCLGLVRTVQYTVFIYPVSSFMAVCSSREPCNKIYIYNITKVTEKLLQWVIPGYCTAVCKELQELGLGRLGARRHDTPLPPGYHMGAAPPFVGGGGQHKLIQVSWRNRFRCSKKATPDVVSA